MKEKREREKVERATSKQEKARGSLALLEWASRQDAVLETSTDVC